MTLKEFWFYSKQTAKDAVVAYVEPVKIIFAFISIPVEMLRQAILCMMMSSDDFKKLQDLKLLEETAELSSSGVPSEDVEKEL